MASRREMEERIRALEDENDELRYLATDSPQEAIWLKIKPMVMTVGEGTVGDVAWAASKVVREGKVSREDMIEYLLGRDESGL